MEKNPSNFSSLNFILNILSCYGLRQRFRGINDVKEMTIFFPLFFFQLLTSEKSLTQHNIFEPIF